jgi:hypothetical protein
MRELISNTFFEINLHANALWVLSDSFGAAYGAEG